MYANVLRAGTLADERVVRLVSDNLVPTHYNNSDPERDRNSPSAKLWFAILKQRDLQGQGLWIVAPDGTVIGGMSAEINGHPSDRAGHGPGAPWQTNPRFTQAAIELIQTTLQKFGPVTRRVQKPEPLPSRGAGIKPDGGVRLVAYNRADSGLVFSVVLTKEDWQAFVPPKVAAGETWSLPENVARKFAAVVSPFADTRFRPWPDDLQKAGLTATVESVNSKEALIRLKGNWHGEWDHDRNENSKATCTAEGLMRFDPQRRAIVSLLMIFDGTYSYANPSRKHKPEPVAAVVRWRLDGNAE